jgi:predicted signal transduction protein with EAL and GGDEF domain
VVFPRLWILFGALFAQSFLNLASRAPWFARLNLLTMALSGVALLFGLRGDITTAQRLNEALSLAGMGIDSSVGVATSPQDGRTLEQLLMTADAALYRAKEAGRGCFRFSGSEAARAA